MATPSATFSEIVTTTLREHPALFSDNMSNHNALHGRMAAKGKKVLIDGGYEIVRNLEYAENDTYQRYSGYETLNIAASDVLSAAKYDWKQAAVNVTASGLEMRRNSGKNQIANLVKSRLKVAMKTAVNNMTSDMYSAGTADGGKQIGGLQQILTQDGTGTVGGINSSTWSFWANQFKDGAGATAATIKNRMHELWLSCVRGADRPDLIMSSNELYTLFWESLTDLQRYTSDAGGEGTAGFDSLKFITADVLHDGGSGIPANTMYFINTDYLELCCHSAADWTQAEDKMSVNQDAVVMPILFQGNLTCSNRARQGVLFD